MTFVDALLFTLLWIAVGIVLGTIIGKYLKYRS